MIGDGNTADALKERGSGTAEEKKRRIVLEDFGRASWGAAVLRPYMVLLEVEFEDVKLRLGLGRQNFCVG